MTKRGTEIADNVAGRGDRLQSGGYIWRYAEAHGIAGIGA